MRLESMEVFPVIVEGEEQDAWILVYSFECNTAYQAVILIPVEGEGFEKNKGPAITVTPIMGCAEFVADDARKFLQLLSEANEPKPVIDIRKKVQPAKPKETISIASKKDKVNQAGKFGTPAKQD